MIVPPGDRTTASESEIARFDAIANTWWDRDGPFRPLHALNPTRLRYVRESCCRHFARDPQGTRPLEGLRCLDLGCGGGLMSEPMSRLGADVTGVDASPSAIQMARQHAEQNDLPIQYRHALPEDLADWQETFDIVLVLELIEHVEDLDLFMEIAEPLLAHGGAMIVSTLNRTWKSLALGKVAAEYVLRWVPAGTHDWRKFVRPSELAACLRRHGLNLRELRGMVFDPLRQSWSLSHDLDVNYFAYIAKPKD